MELEIRYNTKTGEITGIGGDPSRFGKFDRGRPDEKTIQVDAEFPANGIKSVVMDLESLEIIPKPGYTPNVQKSIRQEIEEINTRLDKAGL